MTSNTLSGTKYDHSLKTMFLVLFVFMLAVYVAGLSLMLWDHAHHRGVAYPPPFIFGASFFILMAIALQPRWQLGTDALWQLLGKKTVIAPYASILSVRVIKSKKNGSKVFEIVTSEKTHKLDVLQGEAFENDLASHIGAATITAP